MERYVVTLVGVGRQPQLLIPLNPQDPVSALIAQVRRRAAKLFKSSIWQKGDITLRVDGEDGPLLDEDDLLQHVVNDPKGTKIFAVCLHDGLQQVESVSLSPRDVLM